MAGDEVDSELVRLCDALTEASSVLSRRPELAQTAAAVGTAVFAWAAAVAEQGHDPAVEIVRVLSSDPLIAVSASTSWTPAGPATIPSAPPTGAET